MSSLIRDRSMKRAARLRINNLLDAHCQGCRSLDHLPHSERGERLNYCVTQCSVGRQLEQLGQLLAGRKPNNNKLTEGEMKVNVTIETVGGPQSLTREKYLELKNQGLADLKIGKQFGFKHVGYLTAWKREHGLLGQRGPVAPKEHDQPIITTTQPVEAVSDNVKCERGSTAEDTVKDNKPLQIPLTRQAVIDLMQLGRTVVSHKEEAFQLTNVLDAMGTGWQVGGKSGRYWVAVVEA